MLELPRMTWIQNGDGRENLLRFRLGYLLDVFSRDSVVLQNGQRQSLLNTTASTKLRDCRNPHIIDDFHSSVKEIRTVHERVSIIEVELHGFDDLFFKFSQKMAAIRWINKFRFFHEKRWIIMIVTQLKCLRLACIFQNVDGLCLGLEKGSILGHIRLA